MRFDRLDLNLLVALDALLDTRSVSEASRRLFLSQPAVTGALNRLRDFFGDELLIQSGRRMLLTRKAEELAAPVRQTLTLIRAEITRPDRFEPSSANRHFIIAASDYAYTTLLADVIADASRTAPSITFEIVPPGSLAGERFERAELDLMITVEPFALEQHPRAKLWRDEEVIISWAQSGYPDKISATTFFAAGQALALFGPDRQPSLTDVYLKKQGVERRIEVLLPSFASLPQAVVGTTRLATMHRLYAEHFAKLYPIRLHQAWKPLPDVVEVAQWPSVRSKDPGLKWLMEHIQARAQDLPPHARIS